MRVLFWSGTFWPHIGGVEILAKRLLKDLRKRGHEFIVVTSKRSPADTELTEFDGISIYRFYFRRNNASRERFIEDFVRIRQRVIQLKQTFAPDLIHINAGGVSEFFHTITADTYRAPVLATLHGEWPKENNTLLERILRAADWVVGCSAFILDKARRILPEIIPYSSVIHNGSEAPKLTPNPLFSKKLQILCVGRLSPEKGFDVAITAFSILVKSYPQARLMIVGGGPEKRNLERQIMEYGLPNQIELIGEVGPNEISSLLNTSTLVMVPSRKESFGLVALEAAFMARPVIATRVGGLPEVVVHNETGLLVEPEDPVGLADSMEFLLTNRSIATIMGITARSRAQEIFNWQRYVNAYDALYQELTQ